MQVTEQAAPIEMSEPRWRWWNAAAAVLALAASGFVAARPGNTGDEGFSAVLASYGFGDWWDTISNQELNASLHAVVLAGWSRLGDGLLWQRIPSMVAFAAAVPVTVAVAARFVERRAALGAGFLLAASPLVVERGAEARTYALFLLLSTVELLLLLRIVEDDRRGDRVAWCVVGCLLLYAHLFGFFVLASHALALALHPDRRRLLQRMVPAGLVLGVFTLPWLVYFATAPTSNIDWISRPGPRDVATIGRDLLGGDSWPLAAVVGVAALAGLVALWRSATTASTRWRLVALLVIGAFTPIVTILVSQVHPIVVSKYLIATVPTLAVLVVAGLARLPRRAAPIGVAAIVVLGLLVVSGHRRADPEAALDVIEAGAEPGDAIVFTTFSSRAAFEGYVLGIDEPPSVRPVWPIWPWGHLDVVVAHEDEMVDVLAEERGSLDRVWLVNKRNASGQRDARRAIDALDATAVEHHRVQGYTIDLVEVDSAVP